MSLSGKNSYCDKKGLLKVLGYSRHEIWTLKSAKKVITENSSATLRSFCGREVSSSRQRVKYGLDYFWDHFLDHFWTIFLDHFEVGSTPLVLREG